MRRRMKRTRPAHVESDLRVQRPPDLTVQSSAGTAGTPAQFFTRRAMIACKFCGLTVHNRARAVVIRSITAKAVYCRSRCCGKNWAMPVSLSAN